MLLRALVFVFMAMSALPANAQWKDKQVDLALVLAIDASGSISIQNWRRQLEGYAAVFRSREVVQAIRGGMLGEIAVTLVQWGAHNEQHQSVDWILIKDERSADDFARSVIEVARRYHHKTSVAQALSFSTRLLMEKPFRATRNIIDISGDGKDNVQPDLVEAERAHALSRGYTINALPIIDREEGVAEYYRDYVIGGPRAFMIAAHGYHEFASALRRKLVLEIAQR